MGNNLTIENGQRQSAPRWTAAPDPARRCAVLHRLVAAGLVLAMLGTATASAGSIVGQWTCNYGATPVSGALQSVYVIYANGTWQMQEAIAPTQNLAGTMVRARGNFQETGSGAGTLIFAEATASPDGVNWMPAPLPAPLSVQVQGDGLNIGGILCHHSG
jgi:hypothetical protein